jgi:hypothetical protein
MGRLGCIRQHGIWPLTAACSDTPYPRPEDRRRRLAGRARQSPVHVGCYPPGPRCAVPRTPATTCPAVGLVVKPVGEPDAVAPHVRPRRRQRGFCGQARPVRTGAVGAIEQRRCGGPWAMCAKAPRQKCPRVADEVGGPYRYCRRCRPCDTWPPLSYSLISPLMIGTPDPRLPIGRLLSVSPKVPGHQRRCRRSDCPLAIRRERLPTDVTARPARVLQRRSLAPAVGATRRAAPIRGSVVQVRATARPAANAQCRA